MATSLCLEGSLGCSRGKWCVEVFCFVCLQEREEEMRDQMRRIRERFDSLLTPFQLFLDFNPQ